jgi:hypothetical protein
VINDFVDIRTLQLNIISFSFSYDSRLQSDVSSSSGYGASSVVDRPDLWSEPTAFGDRAHFRVSTRNVIDQIDKIIM